MTSARPLPRQATSGTSRPGPQLTNDSVAGGRLSADCTGLEKVAQEKYWPRLNTNQHLKLVLVLFLLNYLEGLAFT